MYHATQIKLKHLPKSIGGVIFSMQIKREYIISGDGMTHKRFMDSKTWTAHYRKIQQTPTEELRIQAEKEYHEQMMLLLQKDTRPMRERLLDWSHERLELDPTIDLKKLSAKIFHEQWELLMK